MALVGVEPSLAFPAVARDYCRWPFPCSSPVAFGSKATPRFSFRSGRAVPVIVVPLTAATLPAGHARWLRRFAAGHHGRTRVRLALCLLTKGIGADSNCMLSGARAKTATTTRHRKSSVRTHDRFTPAHSNRVFPPRRQCHATQTENDPAESRPLRTTSLRTFTIRIVP